MPKSGLCKKIAEFVRDLKTIDDFAIEDVALSSRGKGFLLSFKTNEHCEDTIRKFTEECFKASTMTVIPEEKGRIKIEISIK